ncbi:potassium/sodium hyperpolarization-activated cyclic nucleotide-gated channel 3-like isoform X2 [Sitophilus oryzae]|uniref:Potassium/sodium hyperpolarization-activated cyclic nucleotide-gated channel 3-like isoform X2 n=1 Tax=Sitophilus oryzae TaxID=7048 RepID=A0A6J2YXJ7_SITOR|nr:potassium/sodium hyperpolarization-activated cyclic nucleotide-gated channel 3-like isoform X2 [Sitophilus oryzae]
MSQILFSVVSRKMSSSSKSVNTHNCELKIEFFGLAKLPPNAPWYKIFFRKIRKKLALNPNSPSAKRFFRNKSIMLLEQKRHLHGPAYIIHPFSTFNKIREAMFCVIWIVEIILSPFYMSFIHVAADNLGVQLQERDEIFFKFYIYILSPLEAILASFFFITGYPNYKTKEIVIDPTMILKNYVELYYAVDFIMCMKFGVYWDVIKAIIATVFTCLKDILTNFNIREEVYDCIRLLLLTVMILNAWTCFFFYIPWAAHAEAFRTRSWAGKAGLHPVDGKTIGYAYAECFLAIACHFFGTGVGSHPIEKDNYLEKFLMVCVMINGRIWTLYIIACILKLFSVVTISESKYEEYYLQLEVFMRQKKLPEILRSRLIEYYKYTFQNHFFNEEAIFATLSAYLKEEMLLYGARRLIAKVELLKMLPKSTVNTIITSTRKIVFLANDVLAKSGDRCEQIYFIHTGTIAIHTASGAEVAHLEDGDQIGLGCIFFNRNHYKYSYTAIETSELYVISRKDFKTLIQDNKDAMRYYYKKLMELESHWSEKEVSVDVGGLDILSHLMAGKILEQPVRRPGHFDN